MNFYLSLWRAAKTGSNRSWAYTRPFLSQSLSALRAPFRLARREQHRHRIASPHTILLVLFVTCMSANALTSPNNRIARLLDQGKDTQAYALAERLRTQEEGKPAFDFLYGKAALRTGHLDQALFAFERVIMLQPDHEAARLALGRTYLKLGDTVSARQVFSELLTMDALPKHRAAAQALLATISHSAQPTVQNKIYIHFNLGKDDNISHSASDDTMISSGAVLPANAREAYFYGLGLGLYGKKRLVFPNTEWFWQLSTYHHNNIDESFDTQNFSASTGLTFQRDRYMLRIPVYVQWLHLDGKRFRYLPFISAELTRTASSLPFALGVFGEIGTVGYPPNHELDLDFHSLGVIAHYTTSNGRTQWHLKSYTSQANTRADSAAANSDTPEKHSHHAKGMQIQIAYTLTAKHRLGYSMTWQETDYQAPISIFNKTRHDTNNTATISWHWQIRPPLTLNTYYHYTFNRSNISLYQYKRQAIWLGLQYVFNIA